MTIKIIHGDSIQRHPEDYPNIDLILTDPPYDWDENRRNHYHEFLQTLTPVMIVFCPPENLWQPKADQTLFWIKPISTKNTSKSYSRFVEVIQIFGRGKWNADRHWSQYTNVFTDLVDVKHHEYRKPPSLLERLILNHTDKGDSLLDPFCGSGTTLEVAEQLGRNGLGFETSEETYRKTKTRLGL